MKYRRKGKYGTGEPVSRVEVVVSDPVARTRTAAGTTIVYSACRRGAYVHMAWITGGGGSKEIGTLIGLSTHPSVGPAAAQGTWRVLPAVPSPTG
jgi:hypothetical protein